MSSLFLVGAMVSTISHTSFGNPVTEWKRLIRNAQRARSDAKDSLSQAKAELSRIERDIRNAKDQLPALVARIRTETDRITQLNRNLANLQTQVREAANVRANWQNALNESKTAVQSFQNSINTIQRRISELSAEYQAKLQALLNTPLYAYKFDAEGGVSFNLMTGAYYADIEIGKGISFDTKKLETLLKGTVPIPRTNPVELILSVGGGMKVNHSIPYDKIRADYLRNNAGRHVYYASERFVDWASAETAAHHVAAGILSGGSTVGQSVDEVQARLVLEFNDIVSWLKLTGQQDLETAATCALGAMLGESCATTGFQGGVRIEGVGCRYQLTPALTTQVPFNLLPASIQTSVQVPVDNTHVTYGIAWSGPFAPTNALDNALRNFDQLTMSENQIGELFQKAVQRLSGSSNEKIQKYLRNANYGQISANFANGSLGQLLRSNLGINASILYSKYSSGNPVINLKGTAVETRLASLLNPIAQGNSGRVSVTKLEFDLSKFTVTAKVLVHNAHNWGSFYEASAAINQWYREHGMSRTVEAQNFLSDAGRNALNQILNARDSAVQAVGRMQGDLQNAQRNVQQRAAQLESAVRELARLETAANEVRRAVNQVNQTLGNLNDSKNRLNDKIRSLERARDAAKREVSRLEKRIRDLGEDISDLERKIRNFIPPVSLPPVRVPPVSIPPVRLPPVRIPGGGGLPRF